MFQYGKKKYVFRQICPPTYQDHLQALLGFLFAKKKMDHNIMLQSYIELNI